MPDVSIYCQVHQPYRLRRFRVFDVGRGHDYFDDAANRSIVQRVAAKCYVPSSRLLADLIRRSDGGFRIALSLSGVLVEQLAEQDRKSTRLNSSHRTISYAVFCLK